MTYYGERQQSGGLAEVLGMSLGKGLGSLTTDYYANKALDKVINDPALKGADTVKRLTALQQALQPFGDVGKNMLATRLGIEEAGREESKNKAAIAQKDRDYELDKQKVEILEKAENRKQEDSIQNILGGGSSRGTPSISSSLNLGSDQNAIGGDQGIPRTPFDLTKLTPEQRLALSAHPKGKNIVDQIQYQEDKDYKKDIDRRDFEAKRSNPILEANDKFLSQIPTIEQSLNFAEQAIETGNASGIGPAIAEITGLPFLKNADSKQLQSALKNAFVTDLSTITGVKNVFIEQQLSGAYPSIGESKDSQQVSQEVGRAVFDVKKKKAELTSEVAQQLYKEKGYVNADELNNLVMKQLKPYAIHREEQSNFRVQQIREKANPKEVRSLKKVFPGSPLTQEKVNYLVSKFGDEALNEAVKLGYRIMPDEFYPPTKRGQNAPSS